MNHIIENDEIRVEISEHGAELRSLIRKDSGREIMWCGDPAFWGRVSPILFPVVGAFRNKEYSFEGQTYHMGQHGFGRDQEWSVLRQGEAEIVFLLEMTREQALACEYPFAFHLEAGYKLVGRRVEVSWRVENPGNETMFYSIGAHPAFAALPREKDRITSYLRFANVSSLKVRTLENGLASDRVITLELDEDGIIPVTEELFAGDALIIENSQTNEVELLNENRQSVVKVNFDAPLFGVWTPPGKNAPFVCIEPWYGRCDRVDYTGTLEEREWGNSLKPGEFFYSMYSFEV